MTQGTRISSPAETARRFLALLMLFVLVVMGGCTAAKPAIPVAPTQTTSPQPQPFIEGVTAVGWRQTGDDQIESSGATLAWHAILLTGDETYVVYSLTLDPALGSSSGATPTNVQLRTGESTPAQSGRAVELSSWRGISVGVLAFPGCLEHAQFMEVEFTGIETDSGPLSGLWTLRPMSNAPDTPFACTSELFTPRDGYLITADKTVSYNGSGAYLGNLLEDNQRLSSGLPTRLPEADPSLIPGNAAVPGDDGPGSTPAALDGVTPTPAAAQSEYLEQMTLRILDNSSDQLLFIVIGIGPNGAIESQAFPGVANPAVTGTPTMVPSPLLDDSGALPTRVLSSVEEAQQLFPATILVPSWQGLPPALEKVDVVNLVSGNDEMGRPQETILVGLFYDNGVRIDQQTVPAGTRLEDKLAPSDKEVLEVRGVPGRGTQAGAQLSPITGESFDVPARLYWLDGDVFYLVTSDNLSLEALHAIAESLHPWR